MLSRLATERNLAKPVWYDLELTPDLTPTRTKTHEH
jgi:hypothetical protein